MATQWKTSTCCPVSLLLSQLSATQIPQHIHDVEWPNCQICQFPKFLLTSSSFPPYKWMHYHCPQFLFWILNVFFLLFICPKFLSMYASLFSFSSLYCQPFCGISQNICLLFSHSITLLAWSQCWNCASIPRSFFMFFFFFFHFIFCLDCYLDQLHNQGCFSSCCFYSQVSTYLLGVETWVHIFLLLLLALIIT